MTSNSAVVQTDLNSLSARLDNEVITPQVNNDAPLVGSGLIDRRDAEGMQAIVNIVAGGLDSTTFIGDGASLPSGSGLLPLQGTVLPVHLFSRGAIGRGAALLMAGVDDSVDVLVDTAEKLSSDLARKMDRSCYATQINPDGYQGDASGVPVNGVYSDIAFDDVSGLREGDAVDLYDTSADTTYTLEVSNIRDFAVNSNSANIAGLVNLSNTVQGISTANGSLPTIDFAADTFWIRGGKSNGCVNFTDICGSGSLHGLDPAGTAAGYGWKGITASSFGVLSQESLHQVIQRVRQKSGQQMSALIVSPAAAAALGASAISTATVFGLSAVGTGVRKDVGADGDRLGSVLSDYESGLRVYGKPVLVDPNCPATQVVVHNRKAVYMLEWMKPQAFKETKSGDIILLDRSNFNYDIQIGAAFNLACRQRRAVALVTGITNL